MIFKMLDLIQPQPWTDRVRELLANYPQLMLEVLVGISLAKPVCQKLDCHLDIWFDNKLALMVSQDGQLLHEVGFETNFRPKLMSIYAAGELLFVKTQGEVLFNRLPDSFSPTSFAISN